MRLSVRSLRGVVKGNLAIQFVSRQLTSYTVLSWSPLSPAACAGATAPPRSG
jgi:hypothetical protein